MANLIVALITVVITLAAMAALGQSVLGPQDSLAQSFRIMRENTGAAARTGTSGLGAVVLDSGQRVDFSVRNSGQTSLREFADWDLFITYQDSAGAGLQPERLTYTASSTPAAGEWTVSGIYRSASLLTPEVYEPGIVNPGEEFILRAQLSPAISTPTDNSIVLAVANGVTLTHTFSN